MLREASSSGGKGHSDSKACLCMSSGCVYGLTVYEEHQGFSVAFASPCSNWERYSKREPDSTVQFNRYTRAVT